MGHRDYPKPAVGSAINRKLQCGLRSERYQTAIYTFEDFVDDDGIDRDT